MSFLRSPRNRWLVIGGAWVAVILLGFWGFAIAAGQDGAPDRLADRVYVLQQLFGNSFDLEWAGLNWQLDVARFLGPIVAGLTFLQGVLALFGERLAVARLRRAHGHVVVAGLGDKGLRLAGDFRDAGFRTVAIEPDATNAYIGSARDRGVLVVNGDASDPALLRRVGVPRAAELVTVCGDDGTNAEIAALARTMVGDRTGDPLRCSVHLVDNQLCALLRQQTLRDTRRGLRLEYFNVFHRGGVALAEGAPVGTAADPVQIAVLGLGPLGQELVLALAQRAVAEIGTDDPTTTEDEGRPSARLVLIDPEATSRFHSLALKHPLLDTVVDVTTIDLDLDRPEADAARAFRSFLANEVPDAVFVTYESDTAALSAGLLIRHALAGHPTTVTVRTRSSSGLAVLLGGEGTDLGGVGIDGFSLLDETCRAESIQGGINEQIARAIHEDYLARTRAGQEASGPFAVPWAELEPAAREDNRRAADGIAAGLAAIGCDVVPIQRWDGSGLDLTPDEIDVMAEQEHDRWRAERETAGWTYGPTKDPTARTNPLLVPWSDLTDDDKAYNRDLVRNRGRLLGRAGFEIVRTIRT